MDSLTTLQSFVTAWIDELWWSMRDRVGALSIIECLVNSWRAAGREVGEIAQREGLTSTMTVEAANTILRRTVHTQNNTLRVSACPFWDKIKERGLEHALRCEEFFCAPYLEGLKEAFGATFVRVETSLRLTHVERAKLEYKLSKFKQLTTQDTSINAQRAELEQKLKQLPEAPACIFHFK